MGEDTLFPLELLIPQQLLQQAGTVVAPDFDGTNRKAHPVSILRSCLKK
jgi:hypothetical protein